MKALSILLAGVQLVTAHHPIRGDGVPSSNETHPASNVTAKAPSAEVPAAPAVPAIPAVPAKPAPAGCKVLPVDLEWPAKAAWQAKVPSAVTLAEAKDKLKHPDYRVDAKTPEDVVTAVKFAADHNIRLSILNSGHDFLGR